MFRAQAGQSHKRWRTNAKFRNPSHHHNQHHLGHKSEPSTAWAPVVQTVQAADQNSYLYWTLLWSTAIFITISGSENGLTFLTTFDLKHQSSFRSSFRRTQSHANCSTDICWITRPKWSAGNYYPMAVMVGEVMGLFVCVWFGHKALFVFGLVFMRSSWHTSNNTSREFLILETWNNPTFSERRPSHASWVPAAKGTTYPAPVTSPDAAQFRNLLAFLIQPPPKSQRSNWMLLIFRKFDNVIVIQMDWNTLIAGSGSWNRAEKPLKHLKWERYSL